MNRLLMNRLLMKLIKFLNILYYNNIYMSSNSNNDNFLDYEWILPTYIIVSIILAVICIFIFYSNNENKIMIGIISFMISCLMWIPYVFHKNQLRQEEINEEEEREKQEEKEANAVCVKDDPCQNDGICSSYGPNLQQYTCECPPEWEGKNCDEAAKGVAIDQKCLKENGKEIPNIEFCNAGNTDDIKWQNHKLVNPVDCQGDENCRCVKSEDYDISCPYRRDGEFNDKYNPYGCNVLNHEVFCPELAENGNPGCVVRSDYDPGENCAVSTIGQSELCRDKYDKHNSYWDDHKFKCIVDCSDNKVYNKYKDKCESFNLCKNVTIETECKNNYCKWDNNKCIIDNDIKQCISMGQNKCDENNDRCEWKKISDSHHKHCIDKTIPPVVTPPVVTPPVVTQPVVTPPVVTQPVVTPPVVTPPVVTPHVLNKKTFKLKNKKLNKNVNGFVVGGLYEL